MEFQQFKYPWKSICVHTKKSTTGFANTVSNFHDIEFVIHSISQREIGGITEYKTRIRMFWLDSKNYIVTSMARSQSFFMLDFIKLNNSFIGDRGMCLHIRIIKCLLRFGSQSAHEWKSFTIKIDINSFWQNKLYEILKQIYGDLF